jgi:hypothetical protein
VSCRPAAWSNYGRTFLCLIAACKEKLICQASAAAGLKIDISSYI